MRSPSTAASRFDVDGETARYFSEIRRLVDQACGGLGSSSGGRVLDPSSSLLNGNDASQMTMTSRSSAFDSLLGRYPGLENRVFHAAAPVDRRTAWPTGISRSPGLGMVAPDSGVDDLKLRPSSSSAARSPRSTFNSEDENSDDDVDEEAMSSGEHDSIDWNENSARATPSRHSQNNRQRDNGNWITKSLQVSESRKTSNSGMDRRDAAQSPLDALQKTSASFQTGNCGGAASINVVGSSSSSSSKRQRLHDLLALATGSTVGRDASDHCSSPDDGASGSAGPVKPAPGSLHHLPCVY